MIAIERIREQACARNLTGDAYDEFVDAALDVVARERLTRCATMRAEVRLQDARAKRWAAGGGS